MKLQIVQIPEGKYAVRKTELLFWHRFADAKDENFWWDSEEDIYKYCLMDTLEEARELLSKLLVVEMPIKYKVIK